MYVTERMIMASEINVSISFFMLVLIINAKGLEQYRKGLSYIARG